LGVEAIALIVERFLIWPCLGHGRSGPREIACCGPGHKSLGASYQCRRSVRQTSGGTATPSLLPWRRVSRLRAALVVGYAGMPSAPNRARSAAGAVVIGSSSLISRSSLSRSFRLHIHPMNIANGSDAKSQTPKTQSIVDIDFLLANDRHRADALARAIGGPSRRGRLRPWVLRQIALICERFLVFPLSSPRSFGTAGNRVLWPWAQEVLALRIQGDLLSRAVLEGPAPPEPLENAVRNMECIEAAFRSAVSGRWKPMHAWRQGEAVRPDPVHCFSGETGGATGDWRLETYS